MSNWLHQQFCSCGPWTDNIMSAGKSRNTNSKSADCPTSPARHLLQQTSGAGAGCEDKPQEARGDLAEPSLPGTIGKRSYAVIGKRKSWPTEARRCAVSSDKQQGRNSSHMPAHGM
jgi:hypothetical protein